MPARTGKEYLDGLKEQSPEIWLDGKRIHDVTAFPGLANGAKSIASLVRYAARPRLSPAG